MALNFPDNPSVNDVYRDSTSGFAYQWNGTVWQSYSDSSLGQIQVLDDISGSFNSSTQTFALTSSSTAITPANAQQIRVVLGGVVQDPADDYTVSGSNITFTTPPAGGLSFSGVVFGTAVPINTIVDGSVTPAKLSTGGPSWNTDGDVVITGIGSTALLVNGDARVTGILTVGTSSITLNGIDDVVTVGTGLTLNSSGISVTGVVTATSFVGDGSGLTGVSGIATNTSINTSGIVTASSFVGNLTGTASTATASGTAYGLTGSPDINVGILTASVISAGSTVGESGQVLQSTGVGVTWVNASSGGVSASDSNVIGYGPTGLRNDGANGRLDVFGSGNFQVFTSPGTFIVNPGISSIRVRVVGAGGNGASGGQAPPSVRGNGGAGGGGGGYAHKVITSFTAPRSYTVTVGTAPGGTSSFGSEVSATGGSNAAAADPSPSVGGSGGSGSGGDVNYTGATGGGGTPSSSGAGGAAATQKGNGSGSSVPGLPSLNTSVSVNLSVSPGTPSNNAGAIVHRTDNFISRFPFDIFNGYNGANRLSGSSSYPTLFDGFNGGKGGNGANGGGPTFSPGSPGAKGGFAGGGGRGGMSSPNPPGPYSGGSGGAGGLGAGGGGGGGGVSPGGVGRPGGAGGAGIVIVEW